MCQRRRRGSPVAGRGFLHRDQARCSGTRFPTRSSSCACTCSTGFLAAAHPQVSKVRRTLTRVRMPEVSVVGGSDPTTQACVPFHGLILTYRVAPQEGLEPSTDDFGDRCSAAELLGYVREGLRLHLLWDDLLLEYPPCGWLPTCPRNFRSVVAAPSAPAAPRRRLIDAAEVPLTGTIV